MLLLLVGIEEVTPVFLLLLIFLSLFCLAFANYANQSPTGNLQLVIYPTGNLSKDSACIAELHYHYLKQVPSLQYNKIVSFIDIWNSTYDTKWLGYFENSISDNCREGRGP